MTDIAASRGYGWIPSRPDFRDLRNAFPEVDPTALPDLVDLRWPVAGQARSYLPATIYDQLQLGSCTANMAAKAFAYDLAKQSGVFDYMPSRLFIYFCERSRRGTVDSDSGASIADAAWTLNHNGAPVESDWPYDIDKYTEKPPQQAYDDAAQYKSVRYARVDQTESAVKQCLAAGVPVCIGFTVYTAFEGSEVAASGVLQLPQAGESALGGHAVLVVGYIPGARLAADLGARQIDTTRIDTSQIYAVICNSWGDGWGDHGHFYMPFGYLLNPDLASDFWTIQAVSSPAPAPVPTPEPPAPAPTPDPTPVPDPAPVEQFPFADVDPWAEYPHLWHKATVAAKAYLKWRNNQ